MESSPLSRLQLIKSQLTSKVITFLIISNYKKIFEKPAKIPVKVTVTGAAGNIGYALIFMIGQGKMFGPDQPVIINLLEVPQAENALKAVVMEIQDCALPLVKAVNGTIDVKEAFKDTNYAILVGARPRGPGMERKDLLSANAKIFKDQGKAINDYADKNCKVNFQSYICI